MIGYLLKEISLIKFKRIWRKRNIHNFTKVKNIFPIEKVTVGRGTYGNLTIKSFGNSEEKLTIGQFCSIAGDVKFLLGGEHNYKYISTFPFKKHVFNMKEETSSKGSIVIEDDVWIGENAIILSGVKVGKGAIIGAGAIVAKDIPPYAIFIPGKMIRFRFSEKIIEKLVEINFDNVLYKDVKEKLDVFYTEVSEENIEYLLGKLEKKEDNNEKRRKIFTE